MAPSIAAEISLNSTSPDLILPWQTSQATGNTLQPIVGATEPYVTMDVARLRTGTLQAWYIAEADAEDARTLLGEIGAFAITYPERPTLELRFVVDGEIVVQLDANTSEHWTVTFGYQELSP